jgi:type I restriction enzyme S subunit
MSDDGKRTLTPKLRFPEFRKGLGWEEKTLGDICDMRAGKFVSASDIAEVPDSNLFPCYGGNGLRGYTKSFTHDGQYPLIGRQGALCGNVRLFNGRFHATEHALVVTPKDGINTEWLSYALGLLELNQFSIGQAQPGLSVQVLEKVSIAAPANAAEQRKIAGCLSSLDACVAGEGRKLEALRAQKKGLMQQLFPREAQTLPRLRFPEFRDKPEWDERLLEACFSHVRNGFVGTATPFYIDGGIPYLQGKNVKKGRIDPTGLVTISKEFHERQGKSQLRRDDIVMVQSGHVGECALVGDAYEGANCHALIIMTPREHQHSPFFVHCFGSDYGVRLIAQITTGNTIEHILASDIKALAVHTPQFAEQQRIADCLCCLDGAIAAQSQKLDSLKLHKKGLMQQLFPSVGGD